MKSTIISWHGPFVQPEGITLALPHILAGPEGSPLHFFIYSPGQRCHPCTLSYTGRAREGHPFIYILAGPEGVTLALPHILARPLCFLIYSPGQRGSPLHSLMYWPGQRGSPSHSLIIWSGQGGVTLALSHILAGPEGVTLALPHILARRLCFLIYSPGQRGSPLHSLMYWPGQRGSPTHSLIIWSGQRGSPLHSLIILAEPEGITLALPHILVRPEGVIFATSHILVGPEWVTLALIYSPGQRGSPLHSLIYSPGQRGSPLHSLIYLPGQRGSPLLSPHILTRPLRKYFLVEPLDQYFPAICMSKIRQTELWAGPSQNLLKAQVMLSFDMSESQSCWQMVRHVCLKPSLTNHLVFWNLIHEKYRQKMVVCPSKLLYHRFWNFNIQVAMVNHFNCGVTWFLKIKCSKSQWLMMLQDFIDVISLLWFMSDISTSVSVWDMQKSNPHIRSICTPCFL